MAGHRSKRQGQAGVTLIEMLVVLTVIGAAAGASMLGISAASQSGRAEQEAVRLGRHLALTVDESLISGGQFAVVWDRSGYRIDRWSRSERGWVTPAAAFAQRHDLPPAVQLGVPSPGAGGLNARPEPLLIGPGAVGPAMVFEIAGSGQVWQVAFDGFAATLSTGAGR